MRGRGLWVVGLACLVVLGMPVAAALTIAPSASGQTDVSNTACTIGLTVPVNQNVTLASNPDMVRVPMNIQWYDHRSSGSSGIIHHFRMDTTYGGNPFFAVHNEGPTTGGMGSPSTGSFYMDVSGVTRNTDMFVLYSVSVYYSLSGIVLCSGDNSGQIPPTFHFV